MKKEEWFSLLGDIYDQTDNTELPCHQYCPECLCEQKEKIFFIPYEVEFLLEKRGIDVLGTGSFWQFQITNEDENMTVAIKDRHTICPFLKENKCTIHSSRPLDCRSFPYMPVFQKNNTVRLVLEAYCPLVSNRNKTLMLHKPIYKRVWNLISPFLPSIWKLLYWKSGKIVPEINDQREKPKIINLTKKKVV